CSAAVFAPKAASSSSTRCDSSRIVFNASGRCRSDTHMRRCSEWGRAGKPDIIEWGFVSLVTPVKPARIVPSATVTWRSEEHTSELQSRENLVCRLLLEKKKDAENEEERGHTLRKRSQTVGPVDR